jgi:hypothetical protein
VVGGEAAPQPRVDVEWGGAGGRTWWVGPEGAGSEEVESDAQRKKGAEAGVTRSSYQLPIVKG